MNDKAKSSTIRDVGLAAALIVIAVIVELAIEHTRIARELAYASYRLFQGGLTSTKVPITLLDISDLEDTPITPREKLHDLLIAVAGHEPMAIGVDIDFAPEERGHVDAYDPQFLDLCLRLTEESSVPVFLGVARTVGAESSEWLGSPRYHSMAATILIPQDTRKLPYSVRVGDDPGELRSLSAALAGAYGRTPQSSLPVRLLEASGLIQSHSPREVQNLTIEEFLVNYSAISSFHQLKATSADYLSNPAMTPFFKNRIVLVGDVEDARDKFAVAGLEQAYPGVMLHASGVTTLINGRLFEVTHLGRIFLTILLLIATLGPVIVIRYWARHRTTRARRSRTVLLEKLPGALIFIYTIVAVICVGLFVRYTHIVWDGFFLAFFALAFHHVVEDFYHSAIEILKQLKGAMVVVLLLAGVTSADAQTKIGYVARFNGTVYYRQVGTTTTKKLAAPRDLVHGLHAGDRLRCAPGGSARLLIGTRSQELKPSSEWFTVPEVNEVVSARLRDSLAELYRVGGRAKSGVELPDAFRVLAPVKESKVILADLILRWNPGADECPITASVDDVQGRRIWQERNIEASERRLDSGTLRTALRAADGPFELQLVDSCDNEMLVTFDVLSSEEVAMLRSDLEAWSEETTETLLQHLGRAAIYSRRSLFLEAADEYEAALALAPESIELLTRTMEALDRTGNVRRRRELAARLPAEQ